LTASLAISVVCGLALAQSQSSTNRRPGEFEELYSIPNKTSDRPRQMLPQKSFTPTRKSLRVAVGLFGLFLAGCLDPAAWTISAPCDVHSFESAACWRPGQFRAHFWFVLQTRAPTSTATSIFSCLSIWVCGAARVRPVDLPQQNWVRFAKVPATQARIANCPTSTSSYFPERFVAPHGSSGSSLACGRERRTASAVRSGSCAAIVVEMPRRCGTTGIFPVRLKLRAAAFHWSAPRVDARRVTPAWRTPPVCPLSMNNKVEVALADFSDGPISWRSAEHVVAHLLLSRNAPIVCSVSGASPAPPLNRLDTAISIIRASCVEGRSIGGGA